MSAVAASTRPAGGEAPAGAPAIGFCPKREKERELLAAYHAEDVAAAEHQG